MESGILRRYRDREWILEAFADEVNLFLKRKIRSNRLSHRSPSSLSPRLVRHYQNLGCIDPPDRDGKQAVYGYRHFLQAVLVRLLQAEGLPANRIIELVPRNDVPALENMLATTAEIGITPSMNAPLPVDDIDGFDGFDDIVRRLEPTGRTSGRRRESTEREPSAGRKAAVADWTRIEVLPGVEIHLSRNLSHASLIERRKRLARELAKALDDYLASS